MRSLHQILQETGAFERELPHRLGTDEPEYCRLSHLVGETLATSGQAPGEIGAVLWVGACGRSTLECLSELLPGLRTIVVFDPSRDAESALADASPWLSGGLTARDCWVVGATESTTPAAWEAAARVLIDRGVAASSCVVLGPPCAVVPEQRDPVRAQLDALLDPYGVAWASTLAASGGLDTPMRIESSLQWATHQLTHGAPMAALHLFYLAWRRDPAVAVARGIAAAWQELQCPELAGRFVEHAGFDDATRTAIEADLDAAHRHYLAQDQVMRTDNLAHLDRVQPVLAAAIREVVDSDLHVAWVPDVPRVLQGAWGRSSPLRGPHPVLIRAEGESWQVVHVPLSVAELRRAWAKATSPTSAHACIGTAWAIEAWISLLANPFESDLPQWRQVVYVVERDLTALSRLIDVVDLRPLSPGDGVEVIWGPDAEQTFADAFERDEIRIIPSIQFAVSDELSARLEAIEQRRRTRGHAAAHAVVRHYSAATVARTRDKLRRGEPLTVWGMSSRHTAVLGQAVTDLLEAMRSLGHDTRLMIEQGDGQKVHAYAIATSIAEFLPDVIVLADHVRPELESVLPRWLPSLSWLLDAMPNLENPETIKRLGPVDLSFPWSENLCTRYRDLGYPHVKQVPFAANVERCRLEEDVPLEDCVAFITHLCPPRDTPVAPGFLDFVHRMFASHEQTVFDPPTTRRMVEDAMTEYGVALAGGERERLLYDGYMVSRFVDRSAAADALLRAGLPVELYGRGWDEFDRFRPHWRGVVQAGTQLNRLYRAKKVILQVNHYCNFHPRVLEAACAGGFVLARSNGKFDQGSDGVASAMELGVELCMYDGEADLIAKVNRALTDEAWRQSFITKGGARVRRDHGYVQRAEVMLGELRQCLEGLSLPEGATEIVAGAKTVGE